MLSVKMAAILSRGRWGLTKNHVASETHDHDPHSKLTHWPLADFNDILD